MEFFPQIKRGGGFYVQINKVKRFLYCIILSAFYGQKIARSFFYVSVESDGGSTILSVLKHAVYNKFVTIVPITRIFIQNPPIWYDTFLLKKLLKKKKFESITANNILYFKNNFYNNFLHIFILWFQFFSVSSHKNITRSY